LQGRTRHVGRMYRLAFPSHIDYDDRDRSGIRDVEFGPAAMRLMSL
jgi:hypothetical protein